MKKNYGQRISVLLIAALLAGLVLLPGCASKEKSADGSATKVEEGKGVPDFSLTLLDGKTVKLSDYRGKVVFLNFWATWCGPCVSEMPDLQKIADTFGDKVAVLAVNVGESRAKVEAFIKEKGFTFSVGLDENGAVSSRFPTTSIPYTLILDAAGNVATEQIGAGGDMYSYYEEQINKALAIPAKG